MTVKGLDVGVVKTPTNTALRPSKTDEESAFWS